MFDQAKELRQRGIEAAKAGHKDEARQWLQQSIRLDPTSEAAWLWLASAAADQRERIFCLQKLLEINPSNETARTALRALMRAPDALPSDGAPPAFADVPAPARDLIASTPEQPRQTSSIPVPPVEKVALAQRLAESAAQSILAQEQAQTADFEWTHKTRGRWGERDIWVVRARLAAAFVLALLLVGGVVMVLLLNNPGARQVLVVPTSTATFTPSVTPTQTPGLTPTPSPTPRGPLLPTATVPSGIIAYDPYDPPRPTEPYPRPESAHLRNAIVLLDQGNALAALPTLAAERRAVDNLFNPAPYYYEALAQVAAGQDQRAIDTLAEAERRITAGSAGQDQPVIDAAYAAVYARLALAALEEGRQSDADADLAIVQQRGESALQANPDNAEVYLALATMHELKGDTQAAFDLLDSGLARPDLANDARLRVRQGELQLAAGEYDAAMYTAYTVLYANPTIPSAHELRTRAALAGDQPGLAVTYAEEYRYYFPGSATAYRLLGDARAAENNTAAALQAYTQALTARDGDPALFGALVSRAGLLVQEGRYADALADYSRAFDLSGSVEIQARRMETAYRAGDAALALSDAEALLVLGAIPNAQVDLLRARVLVDEARPGDDAALAQAVTLLAGVRALPDDEMASAYETAARAHYGLGNLDHSQVAIDRALSLDETGERHYLRGLILEAQEEFEVAAREYEWVLAWGQVAPFDFRAEAAQRLQAVEAAAADEDA